MNTTLDGKITMTKKERDILDQAPKLAGQIALLRPAASAAAVQVKEGCAKALWAALQEETAETAEKK